MNQDAANLSGSLVIRGVLAILFGIAAIFWPGITIVTLVYLFAAFILVNGLIDLIFGTGRLFHGDQTFWSRVLPLLLGFFQVGVGVYLLRHPQVTFATFILLIGFSLLIRGIFEIVGGLFEKAPGSHRVLLVIGGLLALIAGIVVLRQPVAGGVAFVWILGVYALITGPLLIALANEIKRSAEPATLTPVKK